MSNLTFGIVGEFQAGKSTLINCLLGRLVASVGDGTATTHTRVNYRYSSEEYVEIEDIFGNIHRIETIPQIHSITDEFLSLLGKTENCDQQKNYGIVSTLNNWGKSKDISFENYIGSWLYIHELRIGANDQFKIRVNNDWTINYGADSKYEPSVLSIENKYVLVEDGKNITLPEGLYDVYFEVNTKELYVVKSGERTIFSSINVYLNNTLLKWATIVDMPGYGYNSNDNAVADTALQEIDYAIVIITNYKSIGGEDSRTYNIISRLQKHNIQYYLFVNCSDTSHWTPKSKFNINIFTASIDHLNFYTPLLNTIGAPIVNLLWYWYSLCPTDPIFEDYKHLLTKSIEQYKHESNFKSIEEIFSMDNRMYLELKKEFKDELAKLKEELCPVGTIQTFAFNKVPQGWMICDGRNLNKYEYPELFNVIANTFGNEGNDNFKIPDLRGRFIRGWDPTATIDPQRRHLGTYQEDAIQSHDHSFYSKRVSLSASGDHSHTAKATRISIDQGMLSSVRVVQWLSLSGDDTGSTTSNGDHTHELKLNGNPISQANNARTSTETRPKNCALLFCIKVTSNT